MDVHLSSNNERNNIHFNLIFLGIFLMEIISGIIGVFMLSIRIDLLILLFSIIFMSGIYTVNYSLLLLLLLLLFHLNTNLFLFYFKISKKTLSHLLAFCIINLSPIAVLIGPII